MPVTSGVIGISDAKERRAIVVFASTVAVTQHGAGDLATLSAEGADLQLLNTGRCPLLLDHVRNVENVIGVCEVAWLENGQAMAVVRFATTPKAMQIWDMVADGILTSVSAGFRSTLAEEGVDGPATIQQWCPYEISIVCIPADWTARVCREIPGDEVDRVAAVALTQRQTELQEAVRAHKRREWQGMARNMAPGIAARLGVDPETTTAALAEAVERHHAEGLIHGN